MAYWKFLSLTVDTGDPQTLNKQNPIRKDSCGKSLADAELHHYSVEHKLNNSGNYC